MPEPLSEGAHDTEEAGVPGSEDRDRTVRCFDPLQRLREISLEDGGASGLYAQSLEITLAPGHENGALQRLTGLRAPRSAVHPDHGDPAQDAAQVVSASAPGLAPTGSNVSKSTMMTCASSFPSAYSFRFSDASAHKRCGASSSPASRQSS